MGTNRKLPFGYRMEFGRIAIHLEEANWVQHIFTQYNQGVSFQGITDKMRNSGMPYDGDKQWNKNMIAISYYISPRSALLFRNIQHFGSC